MKGLVTLLLIAGIGAGLYFYRNQGAGGSNLSYDGNQLVVNAGDLQGRLSIEQDAFSETYMLFGGDATEHPNALSPIILAGLSTIDAKPIYADFPDFHLCKSNGAAYAKPLVQTLNIIPSNNKILKILKQSLEDFNKNIRTHGDRVCVTIELASLILHSAKIVAHDTDVTDTFGITRFHLASAAKRADCKAALTGG